MYSSVHWTSHSIQGTEKTRPCFLVTLCTFPLSNNQFPLIFNNYIHIIILNGILGNIVNFIIFSSFTPRGVKTIYCAQGRIPDLSKGGGRKSCPQIIWRAKARAAINNKTNGRRMRILLGIVWISIWFFFMILWFSPWSVFWWGGGIVPGPHYPRCQCLIIPPHSPIIQSIRIWWILYRKPTGRSGEGGRGHPSPTTYTPQNWNFLIFFTSESMFGDRGPLYCIRKNK